MPLALLLFGHHLRRRTARERRIFWGAITGHCVAAVFALTFGMLPPEGWTAQETTRGFFGMWSLLLLPAVGALTGWVLWAKNAKSLRSTQSSPTRN